MGTLIRCLTSDGSVMAMVEDATDIVARAEQIHHSSAVVTAGLGRLLTAASMMGAMQKGERDSLTLKIAGGGPVGTVTAVADSHGHVRGYAQRPVVEIPLKANGKLDVGSALGHEGMLYVLRDTGGDQPYTGCIPLVSGEVAEDIAAYYAQSEQIPTVCSLGVLVNPDLTVRAAGGLLIQLLPFCPDSALEQVERNVSSLPPMTSLLEQGLSVRGIAERALSGLTFDVLEEYSPNYRCTCSKERILRALLTMKPEDLLSLPDADGKIEITCQFCDAVYTLDEADLARLIAK